MCKQTYCIMAGTRCQTDVDAYDLMWYNAHRKRVVGQDSLCSLHRNSGEIVAYLAPYKHKQVFWQGNMVSEHYVTFCSREANPIQVEGILHLPAGKEGKGAGVVICHPHSLYGGSMGVPLVVAISEELAQRRVVALRFNFRGVGRSQGTYANGEGEMADVAGALDFLEGQASVDRERLYLVGYSFGAGVGLRHAENDPRIAAVAVVAPYVENPSESLLRSYTKPKLFLVGEGDTVCPTEWLRAFVAPLPEPKSLRILPGTDHFFWGREREVAEIVGEFLANDLQVRRT
jgi:alpha/beta superfamily hydrolase